MIQNTSLEAHDKILKTLGERQKNVMWALTSGGAMCNLQIAEFLERPINSITPRVLELREIGLIEESHKAVSPSGRRAIYWQVVSKEKQKELFTNL